MKYPAVIFEIFSDQFIWFRIANRIKFDFADF